MKLQIASDILYDPRGLIHCKGGSSGGGSSSGKVSYPTYMQNCHGDWLNDSTADSIEKSVTACMNSAIGSSPYTAAAPYDPSATLAIMDTYVDALDALVVSISHESDVDSMVTQAASSVDTTVSPAAYVTAKIAAYAADIDADLAANTYPRLAARFRDISAVLSSAYVIATTEVDNNRDRQVAKFTADMYYQVDRERSDLIKSLVDAMTRLFTNKLEYQRACSAMGVEFGRMSIVAQSEYYAKDLEIDVSDAKWDLEAFQYGANVLAAIGGGTAQPAGAKQESQVSSSIGGALSGAVAGATVGNMITPGIGTAIGAGVGAVLGLASSFL